MHIIEHLPYFMLLALLAEILGTIGGFGSSLLFVPIASYFLDFQSVLGITALFHVTSNINKIALFRKGYNRSLIINIGIPAVLFVILGAYLSKWMNTKMLEIGLSIFLIATSLGLLLIRKIQIQANLNNSIVGGALSGFAAGLIGTGGAIRGITLAAFNLKTEVFIATSALIDLGIDASRSVVYCANGYMHWHDMYLIPILFIVSFVGTWMGKKLVTHIKDEHFKSLVLLMVLLTGIGTLIKLI
jgi:uncharacterized membrane protein YfcA